MTATIDLTELTRTAVGHLSMIRQIKRGEYKGSGADLDGRLTWLRTNAPLLREGDDLAKMVADEADRVLSQSVAPAAGSVSESQTDCAVAA